MGSLSRSLVRIQGNFRRMASADAAELISASALVYPKDLSLIFVFRR